MRKPVAPVSNLSDDGPCHLAQLDSKLFGQLPRLMEFLAVTRFEDKTPRWPGTLILRTEGSIWKIILKEPTTSLMLTVVASTFDDVFAATELLLGADQAPWEADPNAWQPKKGKSKSS